MRIEKISDYKYKVISSLNNQIEFDDYSKALSFIKRISKKNNNKKVKITNTTYKPLQFMKFLEQ